MGLGVGGVVRIGVGLGSALERELWVPPETLY